jgi:hypothetical protein
MWIVSEIAAMATDLAEFLGGAIGLALLFHLPLIAGMAVTALVTYGLLFFERAGFRPLELVIGALVGLIGLCYLLELFIVPVAWTGVLRGTFTARLPDAGGHDRGRHRRRDGHAARPLPAFRLPGARAAARTTPSAHVCCAFRTSKWSSRWRSRASSTWRW